MVQAGPARVPLGARLSLREKFIVMAALMTGMFLFALDQSIVSTAVPHMLADLGGFSIFEWVFTLYLLTSTVTIPIAGKLSDMFGRRNYLLGGVALFVVASLGCGFAPSMPFMIVMRGVQGVGGGFIVACVFATLGDLFTPIERARYFAFMTGMFTFSLMAGPAIGGLLTDGPGWRWCFLINLPLGLVAAGVIAARLPGGGGTGGRARQVDFLGSALLVVAALSGMLAIVWSSGAYGWTGAPTLGLVGATLVAACLFVLQERRHPQAVIPLSLFRNVPFVQSIAITLLAASCIFGGIPYLPTFVQTSLGASATASGLVIVPRALALLTTSTISGQVVARTGQYKRLMILGAAFICASAFLLRGLHTGEPVWHLALYMGLMGLGEGMVFPMSQVIVQAAVSQDQQGVAASTRQFFVQIAQAFGVGIFGLLLTTSYATKFTRDTQDVAAAIPAAAYAAFHDPTLALDAARFDTVVAQLRRLPGGEALLARARTAQQEAVADAIDRIFTVSVIASVGVLLIALALRQIPLRGHFEDRVEAPSLDL